MPPADMQEFSSAPLYLQGDELKKRSGNTGPTGNPARARPGTASTTTSTSAIKPAGKNGGEKWIRTDIGDYDNPGFDDLTMSLAFLPDLKTESTIPSGPAEFLST
jgi:alpha-amylase